MNAVWESPGLPRLRAVAMPDGTVDVHLHPAGKPIRGVTDPDDLRACATVLHDAADWLENQPEDSHDD